MCESNSSVLAKEHNYTMSIIASSVRNTSLYNFAYFAPEICKTPAQHSTGRFIFCICYPDMKSGLKKLVYRLIVMFLSTEIFSKRRKIYAWAEEKPE